jgi:hypothetical protein
VALDTAENRKAQAEDLERDDIAEALWAVPVDNDQNGVVRTHHVFDANNEVDLSSRTWSRFQKRQLGDRGTPIRQ